MNTTASQQSFFNVQNVMGGLALVMGLCLSQTSAAQQSGKTASPFGLELGQATCALAKAQLSPVQEQKLDDGDLLIESLNPQNLYAGTKKIVARCHESRVIAVHMVADKGGMGNPAAGEAFTSLSKKYKLVQGGPMPSLGNGYARFSAGQSVIEQSAPHLSFEFTVSYMEKSFYDQLMSSGQSDKQTAANRKRSAL